MSTLSTTKMTARQFLQLGEDPPGIRLELVNGEIEVSPSFSTFHSYTDKMISHFLIAHILEHNLGRLFGDIDTIITPFDVRRPDLVYFAQDRLHLVRKKAMVGPPDLCGEILSPSSIKIDREYKFAQYQSFGVPNYWIIDPIEQTFEAFVLNNGKYEPSITGRHGDTVSPHPFPTLQLSLAMIWLPPDED